MAGIISEKESQSHLDRSGISKNQACKSISKTYSCHQNPIDIVYLSKDGRLLATASTSGTLIRVFDSLGEGRLLQEVRRGTFSHKISDLEIDKQNTFMLVASLSSTMHLFKLEVSQTMLEIRDSEESV